jgi:hypothetical protein
MDLSFSPLTLEAIDLAAAESLCLFVASDERPLTGLAGLADWRLSGRLSRLLRGGLLTGDAGEAVLTQPGARLAFRKLFLFGLGSSDQSEAALVLRIAEALRKLVEAGVREAALQLPSRVSPEAGVRVLIEELQGPGRAIIFGAEPIRLAAALSKLAPDRKAAKIATPQGVSPSPLPPEPKPKPKPKPEREPGPEREPKPEPERNPASPGPRPAPPPSQRYVPPPPKPNVFEKKKK